MSEAGGLPGAALVICPFCMEWKALHMALWMTTTLPLRTRTPPTYWVLGARPKPGAGRRVTLAGTEIGREIVRKVL